MPADRTNVTVSGIAEARRALRKVGDVEGLAEFRDSLKAAAEIVAADARKRVPSRTGVTRQTVRATAGGNRAYVNGGKSSVPHYGWLDFGRRTPVAGRPRSVGPWAKTGAGPDRGRFIYPALDAKEDEVLAAVDGALTRAFTREDLT